MPIASYRKAHLFKSHFAGVYLDIFVRVQYVDGLAEVDAVPQRLLKRSIGKRFPHDRFEPVTSLCFENGVMLCVKLYTNRVDDFCHERHVSNYTACGAGVIKRYLGSYLSRHAIALWSFCHCENPRRVALR